MRADSFENLVPTFGGNEGTEGARGSEMEPTLLQELRAVYVDEAAVEAGFGDADLRCAGPDTSSVEAEGP